MATGRTGLVPEEHGRRLESSRRIDWRFLLPDPSLGRVAVLGRPDDGLLEALGLFCRSLSAGTGKDSNASSASHDEVVLSRASAADVAKALSLLRPGGYAYVEVSRGWGNSVRAWAKALEAAGFESVRAFWHWPSHAACAEIAPLDDPAAVRHLLQRRRGSAQGRALGAVGGLLLRLGVLDGLVPHASLLARRPEAGA